jgi:2-isopropylmalate synthase
MKDRVLIFDTTLRDGEQSPGFSMNLDEKIRLARQLERLNVDIIEAGFPIASEGDFRAVQEVSKLVSTCAVAALARTKKGDIERAGEALKNAKHPRIHTFIATSDIHLKHKLRQTRDQVINVVGETVRLAKSLCDEVEFSAEDSSRSDRDYLCKVFSTAIEAGADVLNIPDTVGYSTPWEYGSLITYIREHTKNVEQVILSVHCHNDLGLAVANSLAGVLNGARQIECTINGIGERAGNASLEEIAMVMKTRHQEFETDTRINAQEIFPSSELLAEITGIGVQPNKAIVGKNAFAHEAGIHQDGVLKNPLTYEIMTPQSVGVPNNLLVIGKHSGRHALNVKLQEMGFDLTDEKLNAVYKKVMKLSDVKKTIDDGDLQNIATGIVTDNKTTVGM